MHKSPYFKKELKIFSDKTNIDKKEKPLIYRLSSFHTRAIDGARTRGLDLGKVARYQLRHYRIISCPLFTDKI